jgi:hypothetical protein
MSRETDGIKLTYIQECRNGDYLYHLEMDEKTTEKVYHNAKVLELTPEEYLAKCITSKKVKMDKE